MTRNLASPEIEVATTANTDPNASTMLATTPAAKLPRSPIVPASFNLQLHLLGSLN
jgi:hypothetical protein